MNIRQASILIEDFLLACKDSYEELSKLIDRR